MTKECMDLFNKENMFMASEICTLTCTITGIFSLQICLYYVAAG
jgi:hypothetical protein